MKKRLLPLLLVVALLVAAAVLSVSAAEDEKCPCCGVAMKDITWATWNLANAQNTNDSTKELPVVDVNGKGTIHYKLEKEVATGTFRFGNANNPYNITLDLNGNTWHADDNYLMHIGSSTTYPVDVNIFDSVGGGELQGYGAGDYGVIYVANGSKLVLHSGTIRQLENASSQTRGAVYVYNGTMEMKGGKITDGYTKKSGLSAGNLLVRGTAEFTMTGGEITNGYAASQGGGVYVSGGTFTMTDGEIYDNTTDGPGNNIYINPYSTITGATIGGTAEITNGDVYCNDNNLTVSGTPVISELKIAEGKTIALGELDKGAEICVNATTTVAFTAENAKASDYVGYFKTNVVGHEVVAEGNVLKLAEVPNAKCPCCGKYRDEIKWMTWNQKNAQDTTKPGAENNNLIKDENGIVHYQLQADIVTGTYRFGNQNNSISFTLDLNGYTWRSNDGYLMHIGASSDYPMTAKIFDSSAAKTGELQAYGATDNAGVIYVANGSELVLYSGTIRQLYNPTSKTRGAVTVLGGGKMTMHGGKITDGYTVSTSGTSADSGIGVSAGNLLVRNGGEFTMTGGEITNGRATTQAGGVAVIGGKFTMSGGKIYNNICDNNGGNIYINKRPEDGFDVEATFSGDALIEKGVAGGKGANIYNNDANTVLNGVSKIDGDIYTAANMTLVGTVSIPMGNSNGIMVAKDMLLDVTDLADDSDIFFGVDLAASQEAVFTTGGGADLVAKFKHVGRTTSCVVDGTELKAARVANNIGDLHESWCPHCDQKVKWTRASRMTATDSADSALYITKVNHFFNYNAQNIIINNTAFESKELVWDMAGYDSSKAAPAMEIKVNNVTVSLLDTVGGGSLISTQSNTGGDYRGGVIRAYRHKDHTSNSTKNVSNTIVNVYSGTLEKGTGSVNAGGIIAVNSGAINIYGGILKNGKASGNGGTLWTNGAATINISGGLISNGTNGSSNQGGNIYVHGSATLNITGGMVEGGSEGRYGSICVASSKTTNKIENAVIRGGKTTDTTYGVGGNICLNSTGTLTMKNVTVAGGTAAAGGGNISVYAAGKLNMENVIVSDGTSSAGGGNIHMSAEGTVDMKNVSVLNGTAATAGGNIQILKGTLKMDGVSVFDGKANGGNGGNIYSESTKAIVWDNLTVANGIAGGTSSAGGNIYYKSAASAAISNSKIYNGSATGNSGNIGAMVNTTLTNCEIKNGRANVVWNAETEKYDTNTTKKNERSDNIFANKNITLDGVLISGDSGLGEMGTGVFAYGIVTLKGDTVIGNPKAPLSANIYIKDHANAGLAVDSSFVGKVTISSYNLLEDGYRSEPYGAILLKSSYNGEFTGKLYVDDHVTGAFEQWDIGMPEILPVADNQLRVAAAMIRNGEDKTCYENVEKALEAYDYAKGDLLQLGKGVMNLTLSAGNYRIDLFGNQVGVTATGKVNIEGIDRKNYNADKGTFSEEEVGAMLEVISGDVTVSKSASFNGDQYVAIENGKMYDFHYISMKITKVNLRSTGAGIYYKGQWNCDNTLSEYIKTKKLDYGVVVSLSNMPGANFATEEFNPNSEDETVDKYPNLYSAYGGETFAPNVEQTGVLVNNIMRIVENPNNNRTAAQNTEYCAMPIYATAYLSLGDGEYVVGNNGASLSLMDVLKKIDKAVADDPNFATGNNAPAATQMNSFYTTWKGQGLAEAITNYGYPFQAIFQEAGE